MNQKYRFNTLILFFIFVFGFQAHVFAMANPEYFPRPPGLEPAIQFWTRVFTEIDTNHGFIHDDRYLGVVYETIELPDTTSNRAKQKYVDNIKKRYIKILSKLSRGIRDGLNAEEQRVLDLWPKDVSNKTLRLAKSRIRFQLGQSNKYKEGLIRSGAWKPHILRTLEEMGLPKEISALPHVESSFNPNAYSRVGASGLWQFTRSTGRRFMRIDHVVDERMDPFKASVAAAQLLENNYAVTGTWPLALTSYNHGAAGMRHAAKKMGTTDIQTIIENYRSRTFKFASRNFYVAFLAAVDVEQNAEKYFGPLQLNPEVVDGIVKIPDYMETNAVADALGVTVEHLQRKNPALRPSVWNGQKFIPRGYELRYDKDRVKTDAEQALAMVAASNRYAKQKPDLYHRIARGQTLSTIAARYGVKVSDIVALNGLRSQHRIRAGQVLRLPQPGSGGFTQVASAKASKGPLQIPDDGNVTVRRGDTINRIAKRYGMEAGQVLAFNDLNNKSTIYPGQTLRLTPPQDSDTTTSDASIDIALNTATDGNSDTETNNEILANAENTQTDADALNASGVDATESVVGGDSAAEEATAENIAQDNEAEINNAIDDPENNKQILSESVSLAKATDTTEASTTDNTVALLESGASAGVGIKVEQVTNLPADIPPALPTTIAPDAIASEADITDEKQPPAEDVLPTEASELDQGTTPIVTQDDVTTEEMAADPSDYSVADNNTIEVQAAETLGHYAEWLGLRASQLRRINRMRYGKPVVIGKRIKLDFSRVSHEEFERQRTEYHRVLQEAFFEQFQITGKDEYKIRRGDSIWVLAKRKYKIPIWLLRQYNPDLQLQKLTPGAIVTFPRVAQRSEPVATDPDSVNQVSPGEQEKLLSKR